MDKIPRAYKIYRSRRKEYQPREVEATLFRKTFAVEEHSKIKFIGVWDTVGALGNPLFLNGILSKKNQFHDTGLSSRISNAYHALAIDEKRKNFKATLWYQQQNTKDQVLEQVWFPGVHSDVGGGYLKNESGLSDISLKWMLEKVQSCNLEFDSIVVSPDPMAMRHKSHKGFYRLIKKYFRKIRFVTPKKGNANESLHPSVVERYKNDKNYRPKNLVDYFNKHPM